MPKHICSSPSAGWGLGPAKGPKHLWVLCRTSPALHLQRQTAAESRVTERDRGLYCIGRTKVHPESAPLLCCFLKSPPAVLPAQPQSSAMLKRGFQVAGRLSQHRVLPGVPRVLPRLNLTSAFGSSTDSLVSRFCLEKTGLKDYAVPNASWCPDMLSLYHELQEKTKTDGWVKLPSFKSNRDHIQGLKLPFGLSVASGERDWRIFTRCVQGEGQGYEYVIFFHPSKKKSICLFQPGPYLEGAPGFAHGGSLAAMMDETFSKTAYLAGEGLFTVSLNIRFKKCFLSAAAGKGITPVTVTMPSCCLLCLFGTHYRARRGPQEVIGEVKERVLSSE
ncbi:acyl-coenzyme A thioesterase THEM5 isoform X2 [Ailuropoda melanoleuca]|uniref:acyl-coenzyme A thioesterase THEM5 isoform X2 n=1 Tax=Ailuropoda melanoleuca TaxID=9646 RepID=UPI000948142E|nr:acyl-coenzyme A thioesterase THEM5 isoform X2 [Ailuropoda melanoleuca]